MGNRLNWERANVRTRLRGEQRNPRAISKELFAKVWSSVSTAEEAADMLGIEPKDVFWLRKSFGLPFKPNSPTGEARKGRGLS